MSFLFNAMKFYFGNNATYDDNNVLKQPNIPVMQRKLVNTDSKVSAELTKQDEVNTILSNEIDRLKSKEEQLNNARKGQMRVLMMNESYRKRLSEFIILIIAVVIVCALVILMRYMRVYYDVLPDALYTIVHITLFAGLIVYSFVTYISVNSREKINYDRLALPSPDIETSADYDKRNKAAQKSGDLLGVSNSNLCKGAACCDEDASTGATKWDEESSKCTQK